MRIDVAPMLENGLIKAPYLTKPTFYFGLAVYFLCFVSACARTNTFEPSRKAEEGSGRCGVSNNSACSQAEWSSVEHPPTITRLMSIRCSRHIGSVQARQTIGHMLLSEALALALRSTPCREAQASTTLFHSFTSVAYSMDRLVTLVPSRACFRAQCLQKKEDRFSGSVSTHQFFLSRIYWIQVLWQQHLKKMLLWLEMQARGEARLPPTSNDLSWNACGALCRGCASYHARLVESRETHH